MKKDDVIKESNEKLKDLLKDGKFVLSAESQKWIEEVNRYRQEQKQKEESNSDNDFYNWIAMHNLKQLNDIGERVRLETLKHMDQLNSIGDKVKIASVNAVKSMGIFDKPSGGLEDIREQIVQEHQRAMGVDFSKYPDTRYNVPKSTHKASDEAINKAIEENEIYREAKHWILGAQMGQVGYGIDKYPETLQESTWTILETLDHIIQESVDKLHYEVMLRIKIARMLDESNPKERTKEHEKCIKNAEEIKEMTDGILESLKDPNLLNEKE